MAHPDDELLSALLDGEADNDFAAHVDGCAECERRLEALRGAVTALQAPIVVAGHVREAAVARAMQTTNEPVAAATGGSKLLRMSTRRTATPPPRRASALSAAAVLVVAIAVGGWAISQIGSNGSDQRTDMASATPTAGQAAENDLSTKAAAADSAAGSSELAMGGSTFVAGDIGRFTSVDEVGQRMKADWATVTQGDLQAVEPECGIAGPGRLIWQATLYFQNTPAVAMVYEVASESATQWVLEIRNPAASGCGLLATQTLEPS